MTKRVSPSSRRKARRLALQAIYQWQLANATALEIEAQFLEQQSMTKVDVPYFLELLRFIPQCHEQLDAEMQPALNRSLNKLSPVELAILRIATYELLHRLDIPYRVVIDEALRLANTFGALEGFKFVNAVLDQVARKIRCIEFSNAKVPKTPKDTP